MKRYTVTYEHDTDDPKAVEIIKWTHEQQGENVLLIVSADLELNPNYRPEVTP